MPKGELQKIDCGKTKVRKTVKRKKINLISLSEKERNETSKHLGAQAKKHFERYKKTRNRAGYIRINYQYRSVRTKQAKEHRELWRGRYRAVVRDAKGRLKSSRAWSPKSPCRVKTLKHYVESKEKMPARITAPARKLAEMKQKAGDDLQELIDRLLKNADTYQDRELIIESVEFYASEGG